MLLSVRKNEIALSKQEINKMEIFLGLWVFDTFMVTCIKRWNIHISNTHYVKL